MIFKITYREPNDSQSMSKRVAWIYGTDRDDAAARAFRARHPNAEQVEAKSLRGECIDGTDHYVIVVCTDGRRYSLDRAYQLNENPGYGVDVQKCVEIEEGWSGLATPEGWPTEVSVAHWMY
jgi:hypothetical protein